jgi:Zn-dependent peptidase ImmA (M78 family)
MIFKEIEQKAQEILDSLHIKDIPIPVEEIAEKFGMQIGKAPNDEFSGLLIRKNGKALIGVNSSETPTRQRFTIAHELGHFFCHGNRDTFVDYIEFRTIKYKPAERKKEVQANVFAAALLMPKGLIEKDVKNLATKVLDSDDIRQLARKYGVSEEAMNFRLINLNLKSEE